MSASIGMFAAGAVSRSWVARLPRLPHQLGPVAAPSYRLASRIVNSIKAGHAVKHCEALADCRVTLLCVPERALDTAIASLAQCVPDWSGKVLLVCHTVIDSDGLAPLRDRGAHIGSLSRVEAAGNRFVAEGDRVALREAKRFARELKGKTVELSIGGAELYRAGISFASSLFTPLIAASVECLAKAGRDPAAAARISEALFAKSLRAFAHAGRKSWSGPLAVGDAGAVFRELEALRRKGPTLARYYQASAIFALEWLKRHPELLERLRQSSAGR